MMEMERMVEASKVYHAIQTALIRSVAGGPSYVRTGAIQEPKPGRHHTLGKGGSTYHANSVTRFSCLLAPYPFFELQAYRSPRRGRISVTDICFLCGP